MPTRLSRSVAIAVALISMFAASSAFAVRDLHGGRSLAKRQRTARRHVRTKHAHRPARAVNDASARPAGLLLLGEEQVRAGATSLTSGRSEAFEFHARNTGRTSAVHVYVGIRNTASAMAAGVYSSAGSSPGALLTSGTLDSVSAGGWDTIALPPSEVLAGQDYWIAVLGTGGSLRIREREQGNCVAATSAQRGDALAGTFSAASVGRSCPVSAFVTGTAVAQLEEPVKEVAPVEELRPLAEEPASAPVAPENLTLPAVAGSDAEGQTLEGTAGSWAGSPTSFAYQWEDCDAIGIGCQPIAGATSSSYLLGAADVAHTLRLVVTAANAGGVTSATSAATPLVEAPPAPANTSLPSISGSALEGQALDATEGTWSGSPTSFSYQWQDCNSAGASCVAISGATAPSYTLAASDAGHTVRVQVTATNSGGSSSASSAQTAVVQVLPPANTALPSVSGSALEGQQLKATNGTWSGSPTSFSYQWQDCNSAGASCVAISGASASSYTLRGTDAGHTIRVQVTATNSGGSSSASSAQTELVQVLPPANTALPSVSGSAVEGQSLKASTGSWSGSPTSFAYQWQDCNSAGASCVAISGALASSYTLRGSDAGHTIRVQVTATNSGGSSSASSAQTAVVQVLPPANTALPSISGSAVEGQELKATNGTWSGSPTSFAYQWQDCNTAGASCTSISGATASSYTLASDDVGHTVRVQVSATNSGGSTAASSAASAVVEAPPPPPPVDLSLPIVEGSAVEGQALVATAGTWSGSPASLAYQWQDCNSAGASCLAISGASTSSYTLTASDAGHTVRVQVTATNSGGSTAASSVQSAVVQVLAPANKVLPFVSGAAVEGQELKASNGSWSGNPTSFAYQWQDCSSSGGSCSEIAGATGPAYTLSASDLGHTIRVQVTASNEAGSSAAVSAATASVEAPPPPPPPAPMNVTPPALEGAALEGQTLQATAGTWTEGPESFAYQWQDCNSAGASCVAITGATTSSYTLRASDAGHTIRVQVTATNSGGSTASSSLQSAVVQVLPPANTALPALSGAAVEGQELKSTNGSWSGAPTSYAYQWQDCDTAGASCVAISGATASSYTLAASDAGHTVRVLVSATNSGGSASASSAQSAVVQVLPRRTLASLDQRLGGRRPGTQSRERVVVWQPHLLCLPVAGLQLGGRLVRGISGATASSYTLPRLTPATLSGCGDRDERGGSASASSAQSAVVQVLPPANTALPSISGSALEGQSLKASNGSWSGSPDVVCLPVAGLQLGGLLVRGDLGRHGIELRAGGV